MKDSNNAIISTKATASQKNRWEQEAKKRGMTLSHWIRETLAENYEKNNFIFNNKAEKKRSFLQRLTGFFTPKKSNVRYGK